MTRFHGPVGYADTVENPEGSGIWVNEVEEFHYSGEVLRDARKLQNDGQQLNDDISVVNRISIVANAYAFQHFVKIKYVEWMGVRWVVTNVEVQPPRLILSIGSVYNGPTP